MNNNLNVFDAISLSDYKHGEKDYITSLLYDNFMNNKSTLFFRKQNKTILIRLFLDITLWGNKKTIPILIYLNKDFPVLPPDIYIEKICDMGKSPQNLYTDVNFKIRTPKLIDWSRTGGLNAVILEIIDYMNKNFPIYKLDDGGKKIKQYYPPETVLNMNDIIEIKFDAPERIDIIQPGRTDRTDHFDPYHHSKSETNITHHVVHRQFGEKDIKEILIKEIVSKVHHKIKKEYFTINQYQNELIALRQDITKRKEFYTYVLGHKDNVMNSMNQMTTGLCDQIAKLNEYISAQKEVSKDTLSLVKVQNENLIKLIAIEATCEDYLAIVKKAFERGILSVKDTMRTIRTLTRELFVIKYYRNKISN
jgi:hypothetical protein